MPARVALFLSVLAALALLAVVRAHAGPLVDEVKIGVLDHDVPDLWSGFRAEPNSVDINIEALLSPSVLFLGGTVRPAIGGTINIVGATSHAYIDARWQYETPSGIFFGLGIGAAVHDGQLELEHLDEKALGSRVLFHFPIEVGLRFDAHNSLSAYFEHTSNGYTVDPNEGLGYRF
jgi:hypothetical protein